VPFCVAAVKTAALLMFGLAGFPVKPGLGGAMLSDKLSGAELPQALTAVTVAFPTTAPLELKIKVSEVVFPVA
jgi:hypothetical protein